MSMQGGTCLLDCTFRHSICTSLTRFLIPVEVISHFGYCSDLHGELVRAALQTYATKRKSALSPYTCVQPNSVALEVMANW